MLGTMEALPPLILMQSTITEEETETVSFPKAQNSQRAKPGSAWRGSEVPNSQLVMVKSLAFGLRQLVPFNRALPVCWCLVPMPPRYGLPAHGYFLSLLPPQHPPTKKREGSDT